MSVVTSRARLSPAGFDSIFVRVVASLLISEFVSCAFFNSAPARSARVTSAHTSSDTNEICRLIRETAQRAHYKTEPGRVRVARTRPQLVAVAAEVARAVLFQARQVIGNRVGPPTPPNQANWRPARSNDKNMALHWADRSGERALKWPRTRRQFMLAAVGQSEI